MKPMKTLIAGTAFVFGGALAAMTTTAAFAGDETWIASADVKVELDDVQANALQYYPDIEKDLEEKLTEALRPHYSDEGFEITVSLSEISVDGSVLLGADEQFNTLKGWVYIREQGNPKPVEDVGLSLSAVTGEAETDDDPDTKAIVIAPAQNAFYDALLTRFAERTIEEVEGM